MELLLLVLALIAGLLLIPFGLPGLWVMVGAALVYSYAVPAGGIGTVTLVATALLATGAEVAEFMLGGRYARKYGGSRRAEWGAIIGGIVGAFVGLPIPLVGSLVGAFGGAFVGAWLAERSRGTSVGPATRVATGALVGRVVAAAVKVGIGVVIGVWIVFAALTR
jgi:uncharacterized protein YqgC (DUF456 family)